jgi:hypothetical protein
MTEAQVLTATRSTPELWRGRRAGAASVMVAANLDDAPRDVVAPVAMVELANGLVTSYSYRESHGVRVVSSAAEATPAAKARATADALTREGDDLVADGRFDQALDRYDRASVIVPRDPGIEYRIATVLDKTLRPVEALVRYQRFLHEMEIDRIRAQGDANAKLAEAIVQARQRVLILEKQTSK